MIVDDFHIVWPIRSPDEADPKLRVDPQAVVAATVPGQRLEAIPGRNAQVREQGGGIEQVELSGRGRFDGAKARHVALHEQRLGVAAPERANHGDNNAAR